VAFAVAIAAPRVVHAQDGGLVLGPDIAPIYTDLVYPEGLVFDGKILMFTDMKLGAVLRMVGGTPTPIWRDARCGPTSLAKLPSGLWLVACHLSSELVVLDLTFDTTPKVAARFRFSRPNDMYAGPHGVYVSRSGEFSRSALSTGEVWLVRGPYEMRRVASRIRYANGVAVTRDRHGLLVSEHFEGRVLRYPILADGTLGARTVVYSGRVPDSGPLAGPDGIEPAPDGSFYVAWYWAGTILHIGGNGGVNWGLFTPGYRKVTNIALTPDGKGLYAVATNDDETKGALFFANLQDPLRPARE
jgi:sugar lactone lactonase YvrE